MDLQDGLDYYGHKEISPKDQEWQGDYFLNERTIPMDPRDGLDYHGHKEILPTGQEW